MGRYQIVYKASVSKDLRRLPKSHLRKVVERITSLANTPLPGDAKKLQGSTNLYRVRQGTYRILYSIDNNILTVMIVKVGHRKDVYDRS